MRIYEELFILRIGLPEEEVAAVIAQITGVITTGGGTIEKNDNWGVRKLAYRVKKQVEGIYVLIQFTSGPSIVKEIERRLRVNDNVLKFITVRIDEKLKKVEKRKKQREKRAARKPQVAAPAAPSQIMMPASPGAHAVPGPAMPAGTDAPATEETAEAVGVVATAEAVAPVATAEAVAPAEAVEAVAPVEKVEHAENVPQEGAGN